MLGGFSASMLECIKGDDPAGASVEFEHCSGSLWNGWRMGCVVAGASQFILFFHSKLI